MRYHSCVTTALLSAYDTTGAAAPKYGMDCPQAELASTLHVRPARVYPERSDWWGWGQAPAGRVYLVVYRIEDYPLIARHLHIWPFPRGHFQHVALLPYRWLPAPPTAPFPLCLILPVLGPASFTREVRLRSLCTSQTRSVAALLRRVNLKFVPG